MADSTKIEWTDATWNPITGCSIVSPGCTNCYAMKLAGTRLRNHPSRKGLTRETKAGPVWTGEVRFNPQWLDEPLRWKKPRMIFVCAHGDLFAEGVPDEWIDQVFGVMSQAPQHTFQVLTKRPERMRSYLTRPQLEHHLVSALVRFPPTFPLPEPGRWPHLPLPNVWLGTSVEDQPRADERIPTLLDTPAAVRWISAEPLLGPLDLDKSIGGTRWIGGQRGCDGRHQHAGRAGDVVHGILHETDPNAPHHHHDDRCNRGLDWVVVGGESGSGAKPMHPAWARLIRDQCAAASVAFNFKQHGAWAPVNHMTDEEIDACYRSRRKAKPGEDQAAIDESYGRDCIVDLTILHSDGRRHDLLSPLAFTDRQAMTMMHVGKKEAGRRLDGIEHNGFPEPRR